MKNDLTDRQRYVLKTIVTGIEEGKLAEPIIIAPCDHEGCSILGIEENFDRSLPGDIEVLCDLGLMNCRPDASGRRSCFVSKAGYDAIESDFVEASELIRLGKGHRTQLRQVFAERFNESELRTLCFDLSIDYDDLPGQGKSDKVRELICYAERHNRVSELLEVGAQSRPDISWEDFSGLRGFLSTSQEQFVPADEVSETKSGIAREMLILARRFKDVFYQALEPCRDCSLEDEISLRKERVSRLRGVLQMLKESSWEAEVHFGENPDELMQPFEAICVELERVFDLHFMFESASAKGLEESQGSWESRFRHFSQQLQNADNLRMHKEASRSYRMLVYLRRHELLQSVDDTVEDLIERLRAFTDISRNF